MVLCSLFLILPFKKKILSLHEWWSEVMHECTQVAWKIEMLKLLLSQVTFLSFYIQQNYLVNSDWFILFCTKVANKM